MSGSSSAEPAKLGEPLIIPRPGGVSNTFRRDPHDPPFRAVGILYARELPDQPIELRVLYIEATTDAVKAEIAARFGAGAIEWRTCP